MIQTGNPYMQGAKGKFGEGVFKQRLGKQVIARRPKPRKTSSQKQEDVKDKFKEAGHYAKNIMLDPLQKAEYATGVNDKLLSPYNVAFTDYLTAPKVKKIDASLYNGVIGDVIEVKAVDDFKVVSVVVKVQNANGMLLESGSAVQSLNGLDWHYAATKANPALPGTTIVVTAKDKPGNATTAEITL